MPKFRTLILIVAATACLGSGFPTQNREIYDKAQCRLSYARSIRVISVGLSLRVQACHRQRLRGKVPAAVDCNDPWSWEASGYAVGHAGLLHDLRRYDAEAATCTATVDAPEQVGYLSCPAPCDGIAVNSFAAFGECLKCHNQPIAVTSWQAILGTPPVSGDTKAASCQGVLGRSVVHYVHKRMKLQHACEFKHEVSKDDYANFDCDYIGTPGHPLETRINRFRQRLVTLISTRCTKADIPAFIDSCGNDGPSIGECLVSTIEQWSASMHTTIYPPLPPL